MYGSIVYFTLLWLIHKVLNDVWGLEALGGGDALFFLDDERSTMNIITALRMEKFESSEHRKHMLKVGVNFPRIRSKVTKIFGRFFF